MNCCLSHLKEDTDESCVVSANEIKLNLGPVRVKALELLGYKGGVLNTWTVEKSALLWITNRKS